MIRCNFTVQPTKRSMLYCNYNWLFQTWNCNLILKRLYTTNLSQPNIYERSVTVKIFHVSTKSEKCLYRIQLRSVLQGLRQVHLGDCLWPCQICNGPAELQHPVISPCHQLQLQHCRFHQRLAGFIQRAVFPNLSGCISALLAILMPAKRNRWHSHFKVTLFNPYKWFSRSNFLCRNHPPVTGPILYHSTQFPKY